MKDDTAKIARIRAVTVLELVIHRQEYAPLDVNLDGLALSALNVSIIIHFITQLMIQTS